MIVSTFDLTKRYGAFTALDRCTFGVRPGEVFGLLGPNGAGKTTLLRLLLGFIRPTAGRALIDNLDCYRQSVAVHHRVAYMPGEARLFPLMRGKQVLKFFAEARAEGDLRLALEIADRLELDLNRLVSFMSTGMRQKLALAITLSARTPLLILDEPTSNLDPTVRGQVLKLVAEARRAGRTVLFSSHVLSEVEEVCDRVVILRGGALAHTQVMEELRRQHRIRATLAGDLPALPPGLVGQVTVTNGQPASADANGCRDLVLETPGELSPLLGWLSTLPLREVLVEPIGLRSVYAKYHANELE